MLGLDESSFWVVAIDGHPFANPKVRHHDVDIANVGELLHLPFFEFEAVKVALLKAKPVVGQRHAGNLTEAIKAFFWESRSLSAFPIYV